MAPDAEVLHNATDFYKTQRDSSDHTWLNSTLMGSYFDINSLRMSIHKLLMIKIMKQLPELH
jgi:hypothetical protein